jgi:hypothetical protein
MNYQPVSSQVEAQAVTFAGAGLMLVALNGAAHVLPAEAFELLFQPVLEAQPEKEVGVAVDLPFKFKEAPARPFTKSAKAASSVHMEKPKPGVVAPAAAAGKPAEMTTGEAMIAVIREGKHTQAETIDRMCSLLGWAHGDKAARERCYQCIWLAKKNGKVVACDDPETQLPYLALAGAQ